MMLTKLRIFHNFFTSKGFVAGFIIVINTYSWFFPLYIFFEGILNGIVKEYTTFSYILGVHYLAALISSFVGVFVVSEFNSSDKVLISWMLMGTLSSLLLAFTSWIISDAYLYFVSLFLGISLGFGFPSCLAYFSEYNVENKGKHAGMTFLISGLGILTVGFTTTLLPFIATIAIFSFWRGIGCILFLFTRPKNEKMQIGFNVSYTSVLREKAFTLYFIPWIMYCVINYLEASLLRDFFGPEFHFFVLVAEFGIGGIVALISGYLSDIIGRKILIAFGYVMLGMGYAFLGLFANNILSWYVYVIVDGVSLGIFALAFFIVLWGELAGNKCKEKYYLLGEMPYLVLSYFGIVVKPYIQLIPVSSAFSLASFFLFLAVLPLMFAPETLPEKTIKERELKQYIEKAKKVKEKFT
jgi:MFS family permease